MLDPPEVKYPSTEVRVIRRLAYFWDSIRRGRPHPTMTDLDPRRLPIPWDQCFLLAVDENADDPPFDYVGKYLCEECGLDLSNHPVSEVPHDTLLEKAAMDYAAALAEDAPHIVEGKFRHKRGVVILHRSILLPMGNDPATIEYLLGGVSCCELGGDNRKAA